MSPNKLGSVLFGLALTLLQRTAKSRRGFLPVSIERRLADNPISNQAIFAIQLAGSRWIRGDNSLCSLQEISGRRCSSFRGGMIVKLLLQTCEDFNFSGLHREALLALKLLALIGEDTDRSSFTEQPAEL